MTDPNIYKRPRVPHRPWLTGKVYDDYTRSSILHCDARTFTFGGNDYLRVDWNEGGFKEIALDGYLISHDGFTPVWDIQTLALSGRPTYWTRANHAAMSRVHKAIIRQMIPPMIALGRGAWARVVMHAHYVRISESDTEPGAGGFKPYAPRTGSGLPDWL